MIDDEKVNLKYSVCLLKNDVKCSSAELSKHDVLMFIHAAEHLIEYLSSTFDHRA